MGRLLVGAYFFGILMALELYAKAAGFSFLPSQFWAAMPYLMTVIAPAAFTPSTPLPRRTTLPRVDAIVPWA